MSKLFTRDNFIFRYVGTASVILSVSIFFTDLIFAEQPLLISPFCDESLLKLGPAVLPEAPPVPKRAPAEPRPTEPRPAEPKRREVPIPQPDEPSRKIPAEPLEDPKDIQPQDLYVTDTKSDVWAQMPMGLKKIMVEEMHIEREKLEKYIREKYGASDPHTLIRVTLALQEEIEAVEASHKKEILSIIGEMIEERFGRQIEKLTIQITKDYPKPSLTKNLDRREIPELPKSWDSGMIFRTELRNLWQQGEGWLGMKEFAYLFGPALDAISPGLAKKYQELDRLYRFGQMVQLELIPDAALIDSISPAERAAINGGREIVTTDFEIVEGKSIRVKEVNGVAAGKNGWAAAHEARKAAAQIVTAAEGVHRWLMSKERRELLNEATNSARAEIRQGVFGPAVVIAIRKRIELLSKKSLDESDYYQVMEGYFSLPPATFIEITKLLFDSQFDKTLQNKVKVLLKENRILEENIE
ncbi:MAG: hypothetical protein JWQ35_1089 [Bacteriovoracaceae bacterium]|nr:hypothetical protein [Bacteriovoracaceae bacterium]